MYTVETSVGLILILIVFAAFLFLAAVFLAAFQAGVRALAPPVSSLARRVARFPRLPVPQSSVRVVHYHSARPN
jgi:hypothetical protein